MGTSPKTQIRRKFSTLRINMFSWWKKPQQLEYFFAQQTSDTWALQLCPNTWAQLFKAAEIFCWKNVSSFCSAKATHIFSAKNFRILYIESAKTVNEMTLKEFVKLTTLWTTGPRHWPPMSGCVGRSGLLLFTHDITNTSSLHNYMIKFLSPQWSENSHHPTCKQSITH